MRRHRATPHDATRHNALGYGHATSPSPSAPGRRPPRRLPRGRGLRVRLLGPGRGDDGHPRRAVAPPEAVRHITTRHEQGAAFMADVHGRLTGRAAVAMATLGPGATNLMTGDRRRVPRPRADGRDHRPGRRRQAPQGGPPGRRHRPDVRAGHEVEHPRRAGRGDPRDRPQGVPGRDAREARADPHRAAREPRRDAPVGRRPRRPLDARARPTSPSRPTRRSPTPPT